MNKLLQLHIEQASYATRRRYRVLYVALRFAAQAIIGYGVLLSIWWSIVVAFSMTPGV